MAGVRGVAGAELKLRLSAHTKSSESLTKIRHKQAPIHMCRTCPTVYSALARVHGYLHECTHLPLYHSPSTSPPLPGQTCHQSLGVCVGESEKGSSAKRRRVLDYPVTRCSTTPFPMNRLLWPLSAQATGLFDKIKAQLEPSLAKTLPERSGSHAKLHFQLLAARARRDAM